MQCISRAELRATTIPGLLPLFSSGFRFPGLSTSLGKSHDHRLLTSQQSYSSHEGSPRHGTSRLGLYVRHPDPVSLVFHVPTSGVRSLFEHLWLILPLSRRRFNLQASCRSTNTATIDLVAKIGNHSEMISPCFGFSEPVSTAEY
jgi:hypothetical protein